MFTHFRTVFRRCLRFCFFSGTFSGSFIDVEKVEFFFSLIDWEICQIDLIITNDINSDMLMSFIILNAHIVLYASGDQVLAFLNNAVSND